MVGMHVRQEHHMDVAEPRVIAPGNRSAGVVQNPDPGRVLEEQGAINLAEIAGSRAQRRNLDGCGARPNR
jgi:hypothetical protein